ncbi:tyrosine-protein phosphatase non-receptor type 9 isoform X4 [Hyalella azteca]|uniref:Tyrosine-protein phosphatase non-receptor type 9 n=1 Tax=Hyalella azteca TaxID=294128 RepID=A0A979FLE4_HYAAZ|nr:tyrosine-protein phosphatase non-receptor type 9 isoform X4 [Hyalella azteca]
MSGNNLTPEEELVSGRGEDLYKTEATKEFLERANCLRVNGSDCSSSSGPLTWNTAVKFLMARKFDVQRALQLYQQHEITRRKEGLCNFDITVEPLRSELATGKFTILRCRDVSTGAAIALFSARKHDPRVSTHQTTLQALVCQLDAALQSSDTQRHGLIFIYDMTDSLYNNFDYQLSQKILTLLKGAYPARLKKVLIVTAPLWFKAPFKVLRLFVREKLRDRVYTVTLSELAEHIPKKCLPINLGGEMIIDHETWLSKCIPALTAASETCNDLGNHAVLAQKDMEPPLESFGDQQDEQKEAGSPKNSERRVTSSAHDLVNGGDATSPEFSEDEDSSNDDSESEQELHDAEDDLQTLDHRGSVGSSATASSSTTLAAEPSVSLEGVDTTEDSVTTAQKRDENAVVNGLNGHVQTSPESRGSPCAVELASLEPSLHTADCSGFTLDQFVEHLKHKARLGLHTDYMQIKNTPPPGTFDNSRRRCNQLKNRYTDVLCLDHSRVILSDTSEEKHNDYINANFVDGYKQKNAFISTQGPLPHTSPDFWRMIWEQCVVVVVMTTRVVERGRTKCGQYWPEIVGNTMRFPACTVTNIEVHHDSDYITTTLRITDLKSGESRLISHFQFSSWPDYGVPESAVAMLDFLVRVREAQASRTEELGPIWRGHELGPPIVVHCSAGIGRTGTFCTLDICIRRLEDTGVIDVRGTVEKIRSQRAYSIQMPDQYVFCHLALLEYALLTGKMPDADLTGFEGDASDSD